MRAADRAFVVDSGEGRTGMEAEWMAALPRLRERLGERNFATWIEPIHCQRDAQGLRLEVASRFFQEWVTRHFLASIREALAEVANGGGRVRVVVAAGGRASMPVREETRTLPQPRMVRGPRIGRLVPEYTFDTFVVGTANEVAYRAARAVAVSPGRRFNPFFLWGGVGLGKTHLINALAHDVLSRPPRQRMACLSAETFMNTLIGSLRKDQMAAFRERFRALDILILDDVQFLAGKERTQEEFLHTFNALHGSGKQVVLTSDKPPHAIAELEQGLRSRFEGGLLADIHPPTPEMRVAIVKQKAAAHGMTITDEIARLIAERSGATVRELEGALTRVIATSTLQGVNLDADLARRLLAPLVRVVQVVSIEAVQEAVGRRFGVPVTELTSHRRDRAVSFPRQIAMYLSRTLGDASFPSIAEKFGGRDHSTVMHAVRIMELRRRRDPETQCLLATLECELREGASA